MPKIISKIIKRLKKKVVRRSIQEKIKLTKKNQLKKRISRVKKVKKIKTSVKSGRTKKISSKGTLDKLKKNPIISAVPEHPWEAQQTFNPGVVLLDGKVHLLYRAIGNDGISRIGYAVSNDGFTIDDRLPYPIFEHKIQNSVFNSYSYFSGGSFGGCEDPRLTRVGGEDKLYMFYTACDNGLRIGLTSIKIKDFLKRKWHWKKPALVSPLGETHKNWVLFPEKIKGQYAILHSIKPKVQIAFVNTLKEDELKKVHSFFGGPPRKNCWDKWLRGAGAPPIKTEDGWLLFYHAMDNDWGKYKIGVMLLDLEDPTKILFRSKDPVLVPEENYEQNGCKPGVIYVCGAVVKDGELLVYYGGADSHICVAHASLQDFLKQLKNNSQPTFKTQSLKVKK